MAVKRKTTRLRGGNILEIEEYHDGNYGAPGKGRQKKKKPTKEQVAYINQLNKARRCRLRLLEYMNEGDYFGTWTYRKSERPPDMAAALKDFDRAIRKVRTWYRKQGYEFFWIRNIERGTRGAWHIHFTMNRIPGAAEVITGAWTHGGTYITEIRSSEFRDEDFTRLGNYLTKSEKTREAKADGSPGKPRIREASYSHSRNMPLPEPEVDKLRRWKKELKAKKGYYIARIHEGINPATGYKYRRCTMIRLERRQYEGKKGKHRGHQKKRKKGG